MILTWCHVIQSEKTTYKQVDMLIEILGRKPDEMFEKFCDLLKVENSDLYDLLTGIAGETVARNQILNEYEGLYNYTAAFKISSSHH